MTYDTRETVSDYYPTIPPQTPSPEVDPDILEEHLLARDNPHVVTAEQVDTYVKSAIDQKIADATTLNKTALNNAVAEAKNASSAASSSASSASSSARAAKASEETATTKANEAATSASAAATSASNAATSETNAAASADVATEAVEGFEGAVDAGVLEVQQASANAVIAIDGQKFAVLGEIDEAKSDGLTAINSAVTTGTTTINSTATQATTSISQYVDEAESARNEAVQARDEAQQLLSTKQDKLIAGENITIADDGKTISATGGNTEVWNGTIDSIDKIYDDMIGAKPLSNGNYPRLHARNKEIHGCKGFSNETGGYTGQELLLPWEVAMTNESSYLMAAVKFQANRGFGTQTFVQPLVPKETGAASAYFPYALPAFEDSPVYWKGHFIYSNARQMFLPWDKISAGGSGTLALTSDIPDTSDFALKSDIPDTSDFALKSDIPDTSDFALKSDIPDTSDFALKSDIPDTSDFALKSDVEAAIGDINSILEAL